MLYFIGHNKRAIMESPNILFIDERKGPLGGNNQDNVKIRPMMMTMKREPRE